MKTFHLFAGYVGQSAGGMEDYRGSFATKEEAIERYRELAKLMYNWFDIAETQADGSLGVVESNG